MPKGQRGRKCPSFLHSLQCSHWPDPTGVTDVSLWVSLLDTGAVEAIAVITHSQGLRTRCIHVSEHNLTVVTW